MTVKKCNVSKFFFFQPIIIIIINIQPRGYYWIMDCEVPISWYRNKRAVQRVSSNNTCGIVKTVAYFMVHK